MRAMAVTARPRHVASQESSAGLQEACACTPGRPFIWTCGAVYKGALHVVHKSALRSVNVSSEEWAPPNKETTS